jgi:hypothetical protein
MADDTATAGATGATAGATTEPFKVFQTQAEFDAHAAKIRHEAERKARNSGADLAELDTMKAELEQRRQADLEAKGKYEEAKQAIEKAATARADKETAARTKAETALRKAVIEDQLKALAEAKGAYNAADVVLRLKDCIVLDAEYQVRVSDAPGGTVQDGLTMEQAVIDLLKTNPHLAKAPQRGQSAGAAGGASLGGSFSGTPSQREAHAKVEAALARVKANPADNVALADSIRAQAELRKALAS